MQRKRHKMKQRAKDDATSKCFQHFLFEPGTSRRLMACGPSTKLRSTTTGCQFVLWLLYSKITAKSSSNPPTPMVRHSLFAGWTTKRGKSFPRYGGHLLIQTRSPPGNWFVPRTMRGSRLSRTPGRGRQCISILLLVVVGHHKAGTAKHSVLLRAGKVANSFHSAIMATSCKAQSPPHT